MGIGEFHGQENSRIRAFQLDVRVAILSVSPTQVPFMEPISNSPRKHVQFKDKGT